MMNYTMPLMANSYVFFVIKPGNETKVPVRLYFLLHLRYKRYSTDMVMLQNLGEEYFP